MPQTSQKHRKVDPAKLVWVLFLGSFSLILLSIALGFFDTTTELVPAHDRIDQACVALAGICGLLAGGTSVHLTRRLTVIQRVMLPLVFMFMTAIGVFLVSSRLTSIVEGRVDFPAGKTHTRQVLIQISRAYQTHGKGHSQYIQTMPIWSSLEITPEDFAFMQNHRRADDDGRNRDEISSRGYFCASVTIEQSEKAVRILHAGSQKLPQGTVILCPDHADAQ